MGVKYELERINSKLLWLLVRYYLCIYLKETKLFYKILRIYRNLSIGTPPPVKENPSQGTLQFTQKRRRFLFENVGHCQLLKKTSASASCFQSITGIRQVLLRMLVGAPTTLHWGAFCCSPCPLRQTLGVACHIRTLPTTSYVNRFAPISLSSIPYGWVPDTGVK